MKVIAIMATNGRHWCAERVLGMFLDQNYEGEHTLIIHNNSEFELNLDTLNLPSNKKVILLNKNRNQKGEKYTSLGEIYNHTLFLIKELGIECDIITHMDDDDIYFPNHISEGVKGYLTSNKLAYKPKQSWFSSHTGIYLMENVLEPSIFINSAHLYEHGYFDRNVDLHHKWLQPLINNNQIFADPLGKATFIYDWNLDVPVFKTSGDPHNVNNFENYKKHSNDHGDLILTPLNKEKLKKYYNLCKK